MYHEFMSNPILHANNLKLDKKVNTQFRYPSLS